MENDDLLKQNAESIKAGDIKGFIKRTRDYLESGRYYYDEYGETGNGYYDDYYMENLIIIKRFDDFIYDDAAGKLANCDTSVIQTFIDTLKDPDWQMGHVGARMLYTLKDKRALEPLIEALGYVTRSMVHCDCVEALGELKDARAVESLIAILDPRRNFMHSRESACTALGKICDPRGFGPLITAARTPEENVSRVHNHAREAIGNYYALSGSAAEALVKYLKDAGEIDPLISCLAGGKEDVRKAAIGAFEELHDDRAIEALKKVAFGQYTDSELRKIAIELLVNHGVNLSP